MYSDEEVPFNLKDTDDIPHADLRFLVFNKSANLSIW